MVADPLALDGATFALTLKRLHVGLSFRCFQGQAFFWCGTPIESPEQDRAAAHALHPSSFRLAKLQRGSPLSWSKTMQYLSHSPDLLAAAGYSLIYLLGGGGFFGAFVIFVIAKMLGR